MSASGYTLTIVLSGLDPNSEHTINLHSGTCSLINTDKISTFIDDAKADAAGKLSSVTTWTDAYGIPAAGRVVTVHGNAATGGYAGNAMTHIACASLMA